MTIRLDVHIHFDGVERIGAAIMAELFGLKGAITTMSERLSREVQETRDAVNALTGRYQSKIDEMQTHIDALNAALEAGDTPAAQAAADALDQLQTDMAALAAPPPAEEPPTT